MATALSLTGSAAAQAAKQPLADERFVPFELDAELAQWVHRTVPRELSVLRRLRTLSRALLDPRQIGLREVKDFTPTAIEAFRERRANCVGYALLFVGLAREAGVPTFFVVIEDLRRSRRKGELRITEEHLAAAYGTPERLHIFDFSGESPGSTHQVLKVSDRTASALYHSNRGVELMLDGRDAEAARWLRRATDLDPSLAAMRINLGVTLRRLGDLEGAEVAYQEALAIDPRAAAAYCSLAALLRLQGRESEADALLAKADRLSQPRD